MTIFGRYRKFIFRKIGGVKTRRSLYEFITTWMVCVILSWCVCNTLFFFFLPRHSYNAKALSCNVSRSVLSVYCWSNSICSSSMSPPVTWSCLFLKARCLFKILMVLFMIVCQRGSLVLYSTSPDVEPWVFHKTCALLSHILSSTPSFCAHSNPKALMRKLLLPQAVQLPLSSMERKLLL